MTGNGLGIRPTDNGEVLRQMANDPLMIRATRVDSLWGLVGLMDRALAVTSGLEHPLLFLYGLEDQLVPRRPTLSALERLPSNPHPSWRVAVYPNGYHMLLHDVQGPAVVADVAAWATDRTAPLPSGADLEGLDRLRAAAE
jgi:acylglycerol lipase